MSVVRNLYMFIFFQTNLFFYGSACPIYTAFLLQVEDTETKSSHEKYYLQGGDFSESFGVS